MTPKWLKRLRKRKKKEAKLRLDEFKQRLRVEVEHDSIVLNPKWVGKVHDWDFV